MNIKRWVDEKTNAFISEIINGYNDELKIIVGYSDFDLIIKLKISTDSHSIYCRVQESTLGNLAINNLAKGAFAFVNGGGIRNNMKKGNITKADVIEALPWFNNVVVKKLIGQNILDVLEFGVSNYPQASGGFPQVSSELSFDFEPEIESKEVKIKVKKKKKRNQNLKKKKKMTLVLVVFSKKQINIFF